MAKQRGIHQIKGKINNLCYYEQKYIRGGLIRRINEAMSERLKTDPVFENTRRSNTIFGGCSMIARVLLSFFGSRNTFLFKPYRQALLTRAIFRYLVDWNNDSLYPPILVGPNIKRNLPEIINSILKNPIFDSFLEIHNFYGGLSINDTHDFIFEYDSLVNFCKKNNCIGVQLTVSRPYYIYSPGFSSDLKKYIVPEYNSGGRVSYTNWFLDENDEDVVLSTETGDVDDAVTFWIIYAQPILSTLGGRPVLKETGSSCGLVCFIAS